MSGQADDGSGLAPLLAPLQSVNLWTAALGRGLGDLAAGPAGLLISSAFRVMPRQARALDSVERLLAATIRILHRRRRLDGVTLDAVAREAGVTVQAAYRYFADIHDVIRLAVRRVQATACESLLTLLAAHSFRTEHDLASTIVAFVASACDQARRLPEPLRHHLASRYFDVGDEALWMVAATAHAVFIRGEGPCAALTVPQINAGLVAVVAVSRSFLLRDALLMGAPESLHLMRAVLLGALLPRAG
ncbi:transcriptional regulator, TetR family [Pseudoxanthobacter soli DSM 19599]|uniref:Transcriptional regulator, TetR family n=1 Tax=Pseudoxanthobacter soli DSM 19599 TaxID=1123029 RepID=A0A1M7ZPD8_9HYPH|nr:TetR/AcrR family transcriptional regulator [Pseudoxanthobacter soli]SHO66763.1 transcriptional regulator, TetR family [Pseudoxanthobacter soli DSM 19599]